MTNAGAYRADGTLVRTLWTKVPYAAGTYQASWDGLDNNGQAVAAGTYQIKIVAHNVSYTWEGVVGNTSASFTKNVWRSLCVVQDLCMAPNGETFGALGYNEALPALVYSPAGTVQAPRSALSSIDHYDSFSLVSADDTYYYVAVNNSGWDEYRGSYVMRLRLSNKLDAPWSSGQTFTFGGNHTKTGVISGFRGASPVNNSNARATFQANRITGMAVNGSYIAVARRGQNTIQLYNKSTGALVATQAIAAPGRIAFAASGDLWAITDNKVKRFSTTNGTTFTEQNTLAGIEQPLALDAHPSQDLVLVADGGNAQQVKAYNAAGKQQWTHLQAGGFPLLGPDVTNDKAWFEIQDPLSAGATDRDAFGDPYTFVRFQPDGTFWILDTANKRALHFAADRRYMEQIMYLPDHTLYTVTADPNNTQRIFSGNMEFWVSPGGLQPGDPTVQGSPTWKLVKNWSAATPSNYGTLFSVVTFSNGRVYGLLHDNATTKDNVNAASRSELVELPASGPLRLTGIRVEDAGHGSWSYELTPSGDLRQGGHDFNTLDSQGYATFFINERKLTGYDSKNNPIYGAPVATVSLKTTHFKGDDPWADRSGYSRLRLPKTTNGNYVTYQPHVISDRKGTYHMGSVNPTTNTFQFKFHKGKSTNMPDGQGSFYEGFAFGGLEGAAAGADGKDIISYYNGQNNGPSNMFCHFTQEGALIGEFGQPSTGSGLNADSAPAGYSGNALDMCMARASASTLYAYIADEAIHAGIHRWRVDGTDGVKELTGSGSLGGTIQIGTTSKPTSFYYKTTEVATSATQDAGATLTSWNSEPDGSGEAPASFTDPDQTFYVVQPAAKGASITIKSNLVQGTNSTLVIGDGTTTATVRVVLLATEVSKSTTTVDVASNGELEIQGASGALPILGKIDSRSTIIYNTRRSDIKLATATGTMGTLRLQGGSAAALAQNLTLNGDLALSGGGMLQLGVYDATVAAGRAVSGDVTSYVRTTAGGALRQTVAAGSTQKPVFYPVGQSSYSPAWLSQSSAGATDVFAISVGDSTFAQYEPVPVNTSGTRGVGRDMRGVGQPLVNAKGAGRTWYIGEGAAGGSQLMLKLQGPLASSITPDKLHVGHYHVPANAPAGTAPSWDANPADQVEALAVSVPGQSNVYASTRANITDFSPFTLTVPSTLPVELLSFDAKRTPTNVLCNWATASEKNSDYFQVERSADGQNYTAIGKVTSVGNSTDKQTYRYADTQPLAGQTYYRLRQVDKDGTEAFSPVVVIGGASEAKLVASVVPNPSTGPFELITSGETLLEADVYNSLGRHIWRLIPTPEQAQRLRFDLTTYPAGIYILHLRTASGLTTLKMVKN